MRGFGTMTIGADANVNTGSWQEFHATKKPRDAKPTGKDPTPPAGDGDPTRVSPDEPGPIDPYPEPDAPKPQDPYPDADGPDPRAPSPDEPTTVDPYPEPRQEAPGELDPDGPLSAGKKSSKKKGSDVPARNAKGEFADADLEAKYQAYRAKKQRNQEPARTRRKWKERVDWWQENSTIARGNKFNAAVKKRKVYPFNEVNLEDGLRLDSYDPSGVGERVSRKATDYNKVTDAEFQGYLDEIDAKYPVGKKIRSNKYDILDGKKLKGIGVLEVPSKNLQPEYDVRRGELEALAEAAAIELRYTDE